MRIYLLVRVSLDGGLGNSIHVRELYGNLKKFADVRLFVHASSCLSDDKNVVFTKYRPYKTIIPLVLSNIFYELKLFLKLAYWLGREGRPDALYCRYSMQNIAPILVSRIFGVPIVTEVNSSVRDQLFVFRSRAIISIAEAVCGFIYYRHSDCLVTVDEDIKKGLEERHGPRRIVVVPNGVNPDVFKPMDPAACKAGLGLKADRQYVCYVGNVVQWQGLDYLAESAKLLADEFSGLVFLIVGDGLDKKALVRRIEEEGLEDRFIFTGIVPYSTTPLYINSSDVCVSPFVKNRKASPLKIFEYLACAKPVVSSDIAGARGVLAASGGGVLVAPEDAAGLGRQLAVLLGDAALRESMGEKGREYVLANCTWELRVRRILEVIEETVERRRRKG